MIAADNTLANKYAEDFIEYTKQDLLHVAETYMRICFRLYEADKNEYYVSLGYPDIYSCAEELLDLSKSTVSRMISICKRFSQLRSGYLPSMFVGDKYKNYNFSQLCEMVTMKDDDLKLITCDMSVKEIRDAKSRIRNRYHDTCYDSIKRLVDLKKGSETQQNAVATSQRETDVEENEEDFEDFEVCDQVSDHEICEESTTEVVEDKLPEVTRRDVTEIVRDFLEIGYSWIEFPDEEKYYFRYDAISYSFIICYEDGINGKSIDSYHILPAGPKRCFNYNLTLTSRDFFIDTLYRCLKGDINE